MMQDWIGYTFTLKIPNDYTNGWTDEHHDEFDQEVGTAFNKMHSLGEQLFEDIDPRFGLEME